MFATFVRTNFRISQAITPAHAWGSAAQRTYKQWGTELLATPQRVLDVGAGRTWAFTKGAFTLIGQDIDEAELERNASLDQRVVSDACESLGVEPGSVDLVMARAVVEHLHDTKAFCRLAYEALTPGGFLLATFPNKWATFAIINRLMPKRSAAFLLRHLFPGSDGILGFQTYYDACSPREFKAALSDAGFVVEREFCGYYACIYFAGFIPAYLCMLLADGIRHLTRHPGAASQLVYLARKPH